MWLLLFVLHCIQAFSILDLDNLSPILEPESCQQNLDLVLLVHSSPANFELRNAIRQNWGKDLKRIFVLGENAEWNSVIGQEHEKHGDILLVNFQDAYRNMTYKHLIAYW